MELRTSESLGYQVNLAARLLEQALRERIVSYGVVPGQFPALLTLYEQDGLTQAELCHRTRVEQPTMARTLQRMERDGLVRRERISSDARQTRIVLTERAQELRAPLSSAGAEVNSSALAGLSEQQADALLGALARITSNLTNAR